MNKLEPNGYGVPKRASAYFVFIFAEQVDSRHGANAQHEEKQLEHEIVANTLCGQPWPLVAGHRSNLYFHSARLSLELLRAATHKRYGAGF